MVTAFDKLYWMRVGWGILFGGITEYFFKFDQGYNGILLGILGYLVSYYIARVLFFRKVEQSIASKLYTTGIGAYVMMFLFTWLILFTISLVGV